MKAFRAIDPEEEHALCLVAKYYDETFLLLLTALKKVKVKLLVYYSVPRDIARPTQHGVYKTLLHAVHLRRAAITPQCQHTRHR